MKDYLTGFFKEFEYEKTDAEYLLNTYVKISYSRK